VLPFVTAETWSWWQSGSVHRASWPTAHELVDTDALLSVAGDPAVLDAAAAALAGIRKAKSEAKVSMRTPVELATVTAPAELLAAVRAGADDLRAAGRIGRLELVEGGAGIAVSGVELAA